MSYQLGSYEDGIVTLVIPVEPLPKHNRQCRRCMSKDFGRVKNVWDKRMLSCSMDCTNKGCGHLLRIGFNGEETRCGDIVTAEYYTIESPSTMPLVICLKCGKILHEQ